MRRLGVFIRGPSSFLPQAPSAGYSSPAPMSKWLHFFEYYLTYHHTRWCPVLWTSPVEWNQVDLLQYNFQVLVSHVNISIFFLLMPGLHIYNGRERTIYNTISAYYFHLGGGYCTFTQLHIFDQVSYLSLCRFGSIRDIKQTLVISRLTVNTWTFVWCTFIALKLLWQVEYIWYQAWVTRYYVTDKLKCGETTKAGCCKYWQTPATSWFILLTL